MHVLTVLRPRIDSSKPSGAFILIIGCQKGFVYLDESFFVSYGHEVFLRHKAPLTGREKTQLIKGDCFFKVLFSPFILLAYPLRWHALRSSACHLSTVRGALCLEKPTGFGAVSPKYSNSVADTASSYLAFMSLPLSLTTIKKTHCE